MAQEFTIEEEEFCPNCGHLTEGGSTCPNCGVILKPENELGNFQDDEGTFDDEF